MHMCESKVYSVTKGEVKLVQEGVSRILVEGSSIICYNVLGNANRIEGGKLKEVDFIRDKVIIELQA